MVAMRPFAIYGLSLTGVFPTASHHRQPIDSMPTQCLQVAQTGSTGSTSGGKGVGVSLTVTFQTG
jgi:hypothetical protein